MTTRNSEPKSETLTPAVVSQRNHFESMGTLIDDTLAQVPESMRADWIRRMLEHFGRRMLRLMAHNFITGAQRGIEQTANLIEDPDYYDTLRQRRASQRARWDADQKRHEQEQQERKMCPTQQQIVDQIRQLQEWIPRQEEHVARMKQRLEYLKALNPKHIRMPWK